MSSEIKLEGLDQLLAKLEKMNTNVNNAKNKALNSGADIVEQSQRDIVQREAYDSGDLGDGLGKGRITTKKGVKSISIGIQKNDISTIFYGKFINWGFVRRTQGRGGRKRRSVIEVVPGIHFMERSIEENKTEVMGAMKNTIKEAIESAKR